MATLKFQCPNGGHIFKRGDVHGSRIYCEHCRKLVSLEAVEEAEQEARDKLGPNAMDNQMGPGGTFKWLFGRKKDQ